MIQNKYAIITFHFAHNYGAMLQAKALRDYISQFGETSVLNYAPNYMTKFYSLNPFFKGLKRLPINLIKIFIRKKQYDLFENFIKSDLLCKEDRITDKELLKDKTRQFTTLVYGSDQIWNADLTNNDSVYFGDYVQPYLRKISYAASFGTSDLCLQQKRMVGEFLTSFDSISLREEDGFEEIENILGRSPKIVLDPVFLMSKEYWTSLAKRSIYIPSNKYILYYSLNENSELISITEKLASKYGLEILAINPVCEKSKIKATHLNCVGPLEFLYLIMNASFVCTNSFHASAFSIIFQKKLFHKSFPGKEGRVGSLLKRINGNQCKELLFQDCEIYDWSKLDTSLLDVLIKDSKDYLESSLMLRGNKESGN